MGYLYCNADSAIATCDPHNSKSPKKNKHNNKKPFKITHYSYSDLESATNDFSQSNLLGKGSHGSVFKASLQNKNHHTLIAAVKKTTTADNEIEILSRLARSPRLVNLLGLSSDRIGHNLVVLEYMPNGSLHDLLHARPDKLAPAWPARIRFALQVAQAIHHLHSSNPPVIHRDVKSSNVLIDAENNARLADFGLALRGHVEDAKLKRTPPAGTLGYLDPSYLAPGDLSTKSDVFSFGILLLEILSGRKAIDVRFSPPSVVDWAAPMIRRCEYDAVCDPRIGPPSSSPAVARRLAVVAARCVRSAAGKRPDMAEVMECLRAVNKQVSSPIWNGFGRRVGMGACNSWQSVRYYEPSDESATEVVRTSRVGSGRKNRKVSSVPVAETLPREIVRVSVRSKEQVGVGRSRSVGSVGDIRLGALDTNSSVGNSSNVLLGVVGTRRTGGGGFGLKVPTVRRSLNKSRSMGVLQSSKLVSNENGLGVLLVKSKNPNGKEKEESKLLINFGKISPETE